MADGLSALFGDDEDETLRALKAYLNQQTARGPNLPQFGDQGPPQQPGWQQQIVADQQGIDAANERTRQLQPGPNEAQMTLAARNQSRSQRWERRCPSTPL